MQRSSTVAVIIHTTKLCIFGLLALTAAYFLIWGGSRQVAPPPDYVVVHYWEKWEGTEAEQMRQIIKDFNNSVGAQKHIVVQYLAMSNVDQKTLAAVSAGVPPDVAGLWDQQVSQFAALGAVQRLDALAAEHGITDQTYVPVFWNACRYQDHLYALISTPAAVALLYNKQVLRECADKIRAAGLDPNRPPQTLDELDRLSQAVETHLPGGQIDRAGYIPLQSWYIAFTCYWFGGDIFDARTGKFQLASEPMIRSFQWIQSYSKRLGSDALQDYANSHLLNNFDSPENPFLTGKLVMQQQGPWMANYIAHLKPQMSQLLVPTDQEKTLAHRTDNYAWAFAPFPSAVPGLKNVSFCASDVFMIPTGARHPKEAFEFMAYVNRQDVTEKLATMHCKISPLRNVSKQFLENHPNPYVSVFEDLAASPNAHGVPSVPIWPEVYKELTDAAQAVALENADPKSTLEKAQARVQAEYERFCQLNAQRQQNALQ